MSKRRKRTWYLKNDGKIKGPALILTIIVAFGFVLSGGLFSVTPQGTSPYDPPNAGGTCCDTGDGSECQVQRGADQTITFNGEVYGLLKSNATFPDSAEHMINTGDTYKDHRIYSNVQEDKWNKDDMLFTCTKNCPPKRTSIYDAYFKLATADSTGIPDVIRKCSINVPDGEDAQAFEATESGQPEIIIPTESEPGQKNLQLRTFTVVEKQNGIVSWAPHCKPAIYLYPEHPTLVNVKVEPVGPMTITIPEYPTNGWDVIAYPSGQINSKNIFYPYLFYEAQIPDNRIEKPTSGYVVNYKDIDTLLSSFLPALGLNTSESQEFKEYWVKTLPKSPYYFIGAISEQNLNAIAPLSIQPTPKKIIRVTLYFEPLSEKKDVPEPHIESSVRSGFTVVEWGGIFKRDKTHQFSCFM